MRLLLHFSGARLSFWALNGIRNMIIEAKEMLPGWRRAYEAVWSLLPITREHITQGRSCITPAVVLHYAERSGRIIQRGIVPRWEEHDCGPGLYTKTELFERIFADVPAFVGEVILIIDECFPITTREPFFGRGESLGKFLAEVPFVFNGDTVFIWPESRRISVFHHEGIFAHIDCDDHAA